MLYVMCSDEEFCLFSHLFFANWSSSVKILFVFETGKLYRLFGSPFVVSLTELLSIDIKDIVSFIKLSGWFSSALDWQPSCWPTSPSLIVLSTGAASHLCHHNKQLCALKWHQSYHSDLNLNWIAWVCSKYLLHSIDQEIP